MGVYFIKKLKRIILVSLSLFLFFSISKNDEQTETNTNKKMLLLQTYIKYGLRLKEILVVIHLLQFNFQLQSI